MTRSRIQMAAVLVALVACVVGFEARALFGAHMADQFAGVARVVAFGGLALLWASIGWHVYRVRKDASTPR